MTYQAARGTSDILPEEQPYWRYIERKAVHAGELHGYRRIDSPTFEDTGLFVRGVGQGTDIVDKEMYTFLDKGENSITLRPEGTAPVCRAYLEHGMQNLPQPVRLYYFASIFRYERPQAGRLREHHQFGCEAIGEADPYLDGEVIDMAWRLLASLGLKGLTVLLNSIGCRNCRPVYVQALKDYYAYYTGRVCPECRVRAERNPLRLLDCKKPECQVVANNAPKSVEHLCPECKAHFDRVKAYLGLAGVPYGIEHRLVRGLDYYTRTVFEVQPEGAGAQGTILGGGRYDDLIEQLGGRPTPAVGFATGIERLVLNIEKQNVAVPAPPGPTVFIAFMGDAARDEAVRLSVRLRQADVGVMVATGVRSLKAQLRQADALGMHHAVIIGEEELKTGTVVLRDMATATQTAVASADLERLLGRP